MSEAKSEDPFVLWRPSFAGSWRDIGEFPTHDDAHKYAESKPWKDTGEFHVWEIRPKSEGPPEPRIIYMDGPVKCIVNPGTTAERIWTISNASFPALIPCLPLPEE